MEDKITTKNRAFITKSGESAQAIAKDLMALSIGQHIPTVAEYASKFGIGIGTTQKALEVLQSEGAVVLEPRGHLGTFLLSIDRIQLLKFLNIRGLAGVMPLPYSRRYEGLATGLHLAAAQSQTELMIAFLRGARTRLNAVLSGRYDFTIMSQFSAEIAINEGADIEICQNFGPLSYVMGHVVFFAPNCGPTIQPGYRIGVDYSSPDQSQLTSYECEGVDIEKVQIGYMQLMEALETQKIQAAVWASDSIHYTPSGITRFPLASEKAQSISPADTAAVLVTHGNDKGIARLLSELFHMDTVRFFQDEVINGRLLPEY